MSAVNHSIKLPDLLMEALRARAKQVGYKSFNGYWRGLSRYDVVCQGEHPISLAMERANRRQQDKIDAWLLRLVKKGVGVRGVLLTHIVERAQLRRGDYLAAILEIAGEDEEEKPDGEWSNYTI